MTSNAPDSGDSIQTNETQAHGRSRFRLVIAASLLAFLGGLGAMAWLMTSWQGGLPFGSQADSMSAAGEYGDASNGSELGGNTHEPQLNANGRPRPLMNSEEQGDRVSNLEQRLTRISAASSAASSHANRAEAMMIAFAARRALDAGAPLGYVEGQLRLLFGDAQPRAVATIVNAASEPVTLSTLRQGLEVVRETTERGDPNEGWWTAAMHQLRSLAVIRRAEDPSPELSQRIARARLTVESGQIEAAIDEIIALPARPETLQWLEQARRYKEARRALDVIEAAAVLEPRAPPIVAPLVEPVEPSVPVG